METAVLDVAEFHEKMGQEIGDPRKPDINVKTQLRWELIREEFAELTLALEGKDKHGNELSPEEQVVQVADALGDMVYVIAGAAVTWGIDLAGVFQAIHASNMTKTKSAKRMDGKILKGPNYVPPDIKGALEEAKKEVEAYGFGKDAWWPFPTVVHADLPQADEDELGVKLHRKLMAAAAAKTIPKDASMWSEPEENESFGKNKMPAEMSEKLACNVPPKGWSCSREKSHEGPCAASPNEDYDDSEYDEDEDEEDEEDEEHDTEPTLPYAGQFLHRGAFMFDCPCGRTHEVSTKLGSRGGRAKTAKAECMCGNVFDITFSVHNGEDHAEFKVINLGGIPGESQSGAV